MASKPSIVKDIPVVVAKLAPTLALAPMAAPAAPVVALVDAVVAAPKPAAAPIIAPKIVAAEAKRGRGRPKKIAVASVAAAKPVVTKSVTKPLKTKAAAKPAPAIIKGTTKMTDTLKTVEDTAKKFTAEAGDKAQAFFADFSTKAKAAFEKSGESLKGVAEFSKGNMEAMVESTKIAAKGTQTATQNAAEYGRKNFEATTAMFKSVAAVKSPVDFFKLQGDFAKSQFEGAVAEMSKSTEFSMKLMGEIMQPMQNRYAVAVEKVKSLAA